MTVGELADSKHIPFCTLCEVSLHVLPQDGRADLISSRFSRTSQRHDLSSIAPSQQLSGELLCSAGIGQRFWLNEEEKLCALALPDVCQKALLAPSQDGQRIERARLGARALRDAGGHAAQAVQRRISDGGGAVSSQSDLRTEIQSVS